MKVCHVINKICSNQSTVGELQTTKKNTKKKGKENHISEVYNLDYYTFATQRVFDCCLAFILNNFFFK